MRDMDPAEIDPAEIAAAMLREALPGFETMISAASDAVVVRGRFTVGGAIGNETFYAIPFGFSHGEGIAWTEDEVRRGVEPIVRRLVEDTRSIAIQKLGLEAEIARRVEEARREGKAEGYAAGHERGEAIGYAAGREAVLAALEATLREDAER